MGRPKKLPSSSSNAASKPGESGIFEDSQIAGNEDEESFNLSTIVKKESYMCKGSIVRIKMENFMTHKNVQFRVTAGNTVTLICGPNGTGKSAIVCAICIGLGGEASILGRSNQLHGYIRHGATSATTEIELFNPDGLNFIIKRRIRIIKKGVSETIASDWKLNGEEAAGKKVKELVSSLNIQLNNLVTFMPQDRVQEFSKLNPPTLLKLTERAVDSEFLELTHVKLIELQDEIAKRESDLTKMNKDIKHHGVLLQKLEEQVKAFNERKDIINSIKENKGKLVWIAYVKVLAEFSQLKKELEMKKKAKEDVEKKAKWLTDFMDKIKDEFTEHSVDSVTLLYDNRDLVKHISTRGKDELEKSLDKITQIQVEYNLKKEEEQQRVEQKRLLEEKLKLTERTLEQEQQKVDSTLDLENEIKSLRSQQRKFVDGITDLNFNTDKDQEASRNFQHTLTLAENNLGKLKQQNNAKFKFLETNFNDVFKAYEHFKDPENRKEFKGNLHDPMILTLEVSEIKYGNIVEAYVGMQDLTAYFCENSSDVKTFLSIMKRLNLRVSCYQHSLKSGWKPPTDRLDERIMKKFGFTELMSDLIKAPDYYLSYIFDKQNINQIPIGPISLEDKIDAIKPHVTLFYTMKFCAYAKKSDYSDNVCCTVTYLNRARIFTIEINKEQMALLEKTIADTKILLEESKKSIAGREKQIAKLSKEKSSIDEKLKNCDEKLNKVAISKSAIIKIKRRIENNESQKIDLEKIKAQNCKSKRENLLSNLRNLPGLMKKAKKCERYGIGILIRQEKVRNLKRLIHNLESSFDSINLELEKIVEEFTTVDLKVKELAMEAENKKSEAKQLTTLKEPSSEIRNGEYDEEEINQNLITEQIKLQFLEKFDGNIIRDQEAKLNELKKLTKNKHSEQLALNESREKREELKVPWLEKLSSVVDKVNVNFQNYFRTLNCDGEVYLCTGDSKDNKEDDYRNYGIKLKVKFRADEEFTEFTGCIQSGGERAISTALYILALQELTTVPFRVVDEINQGMDAVNESKFYNLLTRVTQASRSKSQYFILTPKLLPRGMNYPEDLGFLFLLNGPYVLPFASQSQPLENTNRSQTERASKRRTEERVERKPRLINPRVANDDDSDPQGSSDENDEN